MAKISKKTFKKALVNSGGNQSTIAKNLQKTRGAISIFLKKNPDMRELCDIEAERIIDVAENIVDSKIINDKDLETAKWKLSNSRRGKERGYGQKQEVEHSGSTSATFNLITKSVEEIKDAKDRSARARLGDKPEARGNIKSS